MECLEPGVESYLTLLYQSANAPLESHLDEDEICFPCDEHFLLICLFAHLFFNPLDIT